MHIYDVLVRPIMTEKSVIAGESGRYTFEVDSRANKMQVKDAVQTIFKVTVLDVNMVVMPAKLARRGKREILRKSKWKKAVVSLKSGDRIQMFEGV